MHLGGLNSVISCLSFATGTFPLVPNSIDLELILAFTLSLISKKGILVALTQILEICRSL